MASRMSPSKDFEALARELEEHPSLAGSIEDSATDQHFPELPSQHSGFRSATADSESDTDSSGPWQPPAWRRPGSGWFAQDRLPPIQSSPRLSRENSPKKDDWRNSRLDPDVALPANVPLPRSPDRRTPSLSPEPDEDRQMPSLDGQMETIMEEGTPSTAATLTNYIRFSTRLDVQHKTDSLESVVSFLRRRYHALTFGAVVSYICMAILAWMVGNAFLQPQERGPGPDLIKVAGLARNFDTMVYYSQSHDPQISELQETGQAVWDLGDSVRESNMTSAPIITRALDELSTNMDKLASELMAFFSAVGGDVGLIVDTIDWAKAELSMVSNPNPNAVDTVYDNLSVYVHKIGGDRLQAALTSLFGYTHNQITKRTLYRVFNDFLQTMEEAVKNEIERSTQLLAMFETLDSQFRNLQRTVIRELDSQEQGEMRSGSEFAELWRRMTGSNQERKHKYNRNRELLSGLKDRTMHNKHAITSHNQSLRQLKTSLDDLRKRLAHPLIRRNDTSTLPVAEQIAALEPTYQHLKSLWQSHQQNTFKRLPSGSNRRGTIDES